MRRVLGMLFILICLTSLSCRALLPAAPPTDLPKTPPATTASHTATITQAPSATATQTFPAASTSTITVTPPASQSDSVSGFNVLYHPDGGLYAGDLVSFEVLAPPGEAWENSSVRIELEGSPPQEIAAANFYPFGIGRRLQATLIWAWDTQALAPGDYALSFTVVPGNLSWKETVTLLPREDLPLSEQGAAWTLATNECCAVNYMVNTAAERDLPELLPVIDAQARAVSERMGIAFSEPITITLLPRVLGHGGFASGEIHLTYLDRNYTEGQLETILHHEMVHILDERLGGDLRPFILVEGLAVYITGGHYRSGQLLPEAATLLDTWGTPPQPGLDRLLPLDELADQFYTSQHEIGYLQAGALVAYMVDRWGFQAFSDFYRGIHPHQTGSQALALDTALQASFGLSLSQLEQDFITSLRQQATSPDIMHEVELTIRYYDALREYQRQLDPSAYFLNAWLLHTPTMRIKGIVADYIRHPQEPNNLALEMLFITAGSQLHAGQLEQAKSTLAAIDSVLQAFRQGDPEPFASSALAADYLSLVQTILQDHRLSIDYEVQRLELQIGTAQAWVSNPTSELFSLILEKTEAGWQLQAPENVQTGE
ncbi:MAG: DUF2268 domain-containing protein [Anaerolineales bacterium]|jgi:hypothetical protein|nr:DUF2268 domain-containing protein [Anaerolineales bacterium]